MAIELKYFVLRPKARRFRDIHARASRMAMRMYASVIAREDPKLAHDLRVWAEDEAAEANTADAEISSA